MIPLFTTDQIRKADNYAINKLGISGVVLMENASLSIFNSIQNNFPELDMFDSIGIVCGKGNNGGDGFALARHFINNEFSVKILLVAKEKELKGDALINYSILKRLVKKRVNSEIILFKTKRDLTKLSSCSVIVDALLGTGAKGEIFDPYKSIIEYLNKLDTIKIAVDLPSGLDLINSTGTTIFNSDLTVTLAEFKTGLFYGKGYEVCNKVEKGSIGIGVEYFDELKVDDYMIEPEDALIGLPHKKKSIHKYSAGKVLVIAGSGLLPGAATLTANSALAAGAGAVVLAFPKSIRDIAHSKLAEATLFPYEDNGDEIFKEQNVNELKDRLEWADIIAIGPGLGRDDETSKAVLKLVKKYNYKKMVIDADAVIALGKNNYSKVNLRGKILTPHLNEFAQLLGIPIKKLRNNMLSIGKKFSQNSGSILILKGAPSIIFTQNGEALINSTGNEGMAKFGTGDVLTGMLAGFNSFSDTLEETTISSVYLHSLSADLLVAEKTKYSITATEIMENLPNAIKFLGNSLI